MELNDDPYYVLAQTGPYEAKIGSALITMVEPHVGHEHAYNRWYEDDHYNAGAMAFPWMWAGRRWVAPVRYQSVRYPADSAVAQPGEAGKYISTYWITDGQYENHLRWAVGTNHRLFADGRVHLERDHTFTSFQRYRGPIYRDANGPRDVHALDHPYGGLVLEVIDAPDAETRTSTICAPDARVLSPMSTVTAALVHGAGHDSLVWRDVQAALAHPSFAADVPGRGARPADLTVVTIDEAAESIATDIRGAVDGDVVLVGHSVAGTMLPAVAARLGAKVRHLVFVAGITAPDLELPLEAFLPGQAEAVAARLAELRARYGGHTLESLDIKTASAIDSLNFSSQVMSWAGVPASIGRTFVRCLRDPIQPRALQDRFIASCGATEVVDIDAGHTPALDAPVELASVLDRIIDRVEGQRSPDGAGPPTE